MKKLKSKYQVFQVNFMNFGDGDIVESRNIIGETFAVSEAQAINNISFRYSIKANELVPWRCEGYRHSYLVAERLNW